MLRRPVEPGQSLLVGPMRYTGGGRFHYANDFVFRRFFLEGRNTAALGAFNSLCESELEPFVESVATLSPLIDGG